ncbi:MAG: hypothetical protein KBC42_00435 [Candidatus Pacebacteria bacterium]|nr:hypothetical protein [Candidatus Paceibacterota bacterium]MBP9780374.1 hypothetical protein [Candidatus Paceibacterota bacterium]
METIKSLPLSMQEFAKNVELILGEDSYSSAYKKQFSKYQTRCFEGVWVKPVFHHFLNEDEKISYIELLEQILACSQEYRIPIMGFEYLASVVSNRNYKINREFFLTNTIIDKYGLEQFEDSKKLNIIDCPILPAKGKLVSTMHESKFIEIEKKFDKKNRKKILVNIDQSVSFKEAAGTNNFEFTYTREEEKLIFLEVDFPLELITRIAFGFPINKV